MSVRSARILKGDATQRAEPVSIGEPPPNTRVVPGAVFEAKEEAARILEEAEATATTIKTQAMLDARLSLENIREELRQEELGKLLATYVALNHAPDVQNGTELDQLVQIGQVLAERLLDEELTLTPQKIRGIAKTVLQASRGHKEGVLSAHPADVAALCALVWELNLTSITVEEDAELKRGSIYLHTDVGELDGRIETQLSRFGAALKAMLQKENGALQPSPPASSRTP